MSEARKTQFTLSLDDFNKTHVQNIYEHKEAILRLSAEGCPLERIAVQLKTHPGIIGKCLRAWSQHSLNISLCHKNGFDTLHRNLFIYYSIESKEATRRQLAEKFGISYGRVCQVYAKAKYRGALLVWKRRYLLVYGEDYVHTPEDMKLPFAVAPGYENMSPTYLWRSWWTYRAATLLGNDPGQELASVFEIADICE